MRRVYLAFAASAALLIAGAFAAQHGLTADEWPDQAPRASEKPEPAEWPLCPPPKECRQ